MRKVGVVEQIRRNMPIVWKLPNRIDPTDTFVAFLMVVLVGAKRFAHAGLLRGGRALHALLGLRRFPTDHTICNLSQVWHGPGVAEWQMQRLPQRPEGYTLHMNSTVFERYGKQEGSLKGHNPRRHGRRAITRYWPC